MKRFAILGLLLASAVAAAPPDLDIPAEVRPAGQYVQFAPKTTAKSVSYVGLDGVDPVPSAVLKDARVFLLDTRGLKDGRYRFAAIGALADEQARVDFVVVVGVPVPPTPTPGPGPTPGPSPTYPSVWAVLVTDNTAPSLEAGRLMNSNVNAQVTQAGGFWEVVDKNSAEGKQLGYDVQAGKAGGAPVVLFMAPDGKILETAKPTSPEAVKGTVAKYTGKGK